MQTHVEVLSIVYAIKMYNGVLRKCDRLSRTEALI